MKKVIFYLTAIFIVFLSCKKKNNEKKIVLKDNTEFLINRKSEITDSLSRNVVYNFYNWYINEIYLKNINDYDHAPYKKINNKYGLDVYEYEKKLNEVRFFAESFKKSLIEQNKKCNEAMLNSGLQSFNPNYDADFYIENSRECDYLWVPKWFGGQEGINNKFEVLKRFTKRNMEYTYTVETFIYDKPFTKYEVTVIKETNEFKIAQIIPSSSF